MKPVTILKKAKKLLSDPKRWTKGDYAFDAEGKLTNAKHRSASSWCAEGACQRFGSDATIDDLLAIKALTETVSANFAGQPAACFNDHGVKSHRNLMQWFDRAIKYAEKNL